MQVYKPTKQRGLTAFPLPVDKFTFLLFLFFFVLVSYVHHHKCARKTGNIRKKQIIYLIRTHPEEVKTYFKKS